MTFTPVLSCTCCIIATFWSCVCITSPYTPFTVAPGACIMGWTKSCPWNLRSSGLQVDWLGCCFEKVWCTLISRNTVDVLSQCRPVRRSHEKNPYLCGRWNWNICVEPKSQSERARVPGTWYMSHGICHSCDLQMCIENLKWVEFFHTVVPLWIGFWTYFNVSVSWKCSANNPSCSLGCE